MANAESEINIVFILSTADTSTMSRQTWIDYAKGIGIILVVYGHVVGGAFTSNGKLPWIFHYSHNIIYHFHMPLFFFLAGLFVHQSLLKRGTKAFIMDKTHRILYPYAVWSVLEGIVEIGMSQYTYINTTWHDVFAIWYKPLKHFWFLYALFFMYAVYAFSARLGRFFLPALLLASLYLYVVPVGLPTTGINDFCHNFIFFVLGALYQKHSWYLLTDRNISLATVAFVVALFIICETAIRFTPPDSFLLFFSAVVGFMMVVMLSKYLAANENLAVIKTFGVYSMPIYLAHGFGGSGTRIILHDFLGFRDYISLTIFISTVLGVVVPLVFYWLCEKWNFPYLFRAMKA